MKNIFFCNWLLLLFPSLPNLALTNSVLMKLLRGNYSFSVRKEISDQGLTKLNQASAALVAFEYNFV